MIRRMKRQTKKRHSVHRTDDGRCLRAALRIMASLAPDPARPGVLRSPVFRIGDLMGER